MAKLITIVGATGAQGKGVVRAFINNPAYQVRAITRNPSGPAGQALAAQGAEVVAADLNDLASLKTAFAGSHIIFAVTNFFEPFIAHQSPDKAMEIELHQGTNLATAAAATPTLEHYIWSTLPNALALSANKYLIPHFEGKNRIDAHIRTHLPALLAKTTFLWVTWYHSNYAFPMFTPYLIPTAGKHLQLANYAPETPITTIGDVSANVGAFVKAAVEQGDKTRGGAVVLAATETHQAGEMLQLWARARGTKAQLVRVSGEAFREIWPLWAEEMGVMMEFWDEYRERSWTRADGGKVLGKEDLGVAEFQGLEEAYKGLEV
ncbi:hypothetical protein CHGG_08489 [Chaetomium globosum CBS 148.51]|uniref:NmrA-like domain-containing protein n=1 Tax=Chaetomium globosum (strain ATCC 6205 / CBS 148.51 / DSM 1962 / NBRC 6347 / NRRL 1970) TaxID=306901 RepID=Q2GU65_CHAGB|nr:uncharacterized protein CHGG_08489 [Chaetomium globosum CBS 148.51]EAQ84475.1 hypothetical protein CHGG_08489 [Chaetomium globosum CBS 148.51]